MPTYNFKPEQIGTAATETAKAVLPKLDAFGQPYNAAIGGLNFHHISPTQFVVVQGGAPFNLADYEVAPPVLPLFDLAEPEASPAPGAVAEPTGGPVSVPASTVKTTATGKGSGSSNG